MWGFLGGGGIKFGMMYLFYLFICNCNLYVIMVLMEGDDFLYGLGLGFLKIFLVCYVDYFFLLNIG